MNDMGYVELSNEQRRQLVDAAQLYTSWRPAARDLERMGSITSRLSKGRRYMTEAHGKVRKSLGLATPALLKRKAEHDARRKDLRTRVTAMRNRMARQAPVNRALRIGTMPSLVARIIRELDRHDLLGAHVIVAGTNALHAYESACGVTVLQEHVATTDADLVWDGSRNLFLAATGVKPAGLMGILRRVDRSFVADYGYNATNRDGFIVDLICPLDTEPTTMNEADDLEATAMEGIDWLLSAPRFEQVIVADDGLPLRIVAPEPRTFALHKLWVSKQTSRHPVKAKRDLAQAALVARLVTTYMTVKFAAKDMPWLPTALRRLLPELAVLRAQSSR